jgi:hypothetical protein
MEAAAFALTVVLSGCSSYTPVVRPTPSLSRLSPELESLTDDKIETYLRADVRPALPSVLAVAKLAAPRGYYSLERVAKPQLEVLRGEEVEGWRKMAGPWDVQTGVLLDQVQLVSPLLAGEDSTLKSLRDAAALLHAPLLLVYMQDEDARQGYNEAAMAYWTIIGLFCVPGNTVGHYSACQGVLVDTRSGFILATCAGESKREENVLPGAVDIARQRAERQSRAAAVADLQQNVREVLTSLARERARPTPRP